MAITQFNGISPTDHNDVNSFASLRRGYSYLRIISNDEWRGKYTLPANTRNIRIHRFGNPSLSGIIIAKNVQNRHLLLIKRLYKDFRECEFVSPISPSLHLGKAKETPTEATHRSLT